jgi:hypothetical protein
MSVQIGDSTTGLKDSRTDGYEYSYLKTEIDRVVDYSSRR